MSSSLVQLQTRGLGGRCSLNLSKLKRPLDGVLWKLGKGDVSSGASTVTASSDVVQTGRLIFDDFFQHLWPYIGYITANVVFQMVKRLWLIRIDQ
ncbi:hypothetical protein TNCV_667881 [Trichonephila clavipes]|nr:hypothetical protein TNCV_667881 [Trichonephila clavipes]